MFSTGQNYNMHILFISDNFPPEVNAPASRTFEHCTEWVKLGHKVTVITCAPNFPIGKVFDGYKNKIWRVDNMNGINVCRVWTYIAPNEKFFKRTIDYLSFMVTSFIASMFIRKVDIIIGTSPQIFTACSAFLVGIFKKKPWIFELRDLWPESIQAVGAIRNKRLLKSLEKMEMFLYRKSTAIVSVTHSFKAKLIQRGINGDKIFVITNGVNLNNYGVKSRSNKLLETYNLNDRFVVGYIGTIGLAHSLDIILNFADENKDKSQYVFLIIGEGADKKRLLEIKNKKNIENVIFINSVSRNEIVDYWAILDASLVHLKKTDLFKTVIPSKIFEAMASAKPILLGVDGEANDIITETKTGVVFEPENVDDFAKKLNSLVYDKTLYRQLVNNGPKTAEKYNRKVLAKKMLEVIEMHA